MSRLQVQKLLSRTGATAVTIEDDGSLNLNTGLAAEVDMWAMNSNLQVNGLSTINVYWYRVGTSTNAQYNAFTKLGTGMTQDAGVFTFPNTGTWRVYFRNVWHAPAGSGDQSKYNSGSINLSTDGGSSYLAGSLATCYTNLDETGFYASASCETYITVTDASLFKVRFQCQGEGTNNMLVGSSAFIYNHVIFSKVITGT